jgi:hypothetical protein
MEHNKSLGFAIGFMGPTKQKNNHILVWQLGPKKARGVIYHGLNKELILELGE